MYWSSLSPEHRARELINLVYLARRCARLPGLDEDERHTWQAEADRAWTMAQPLLPRLPATGPSACEVLDMADRLAEEMAELRVPRRTA